MKTTNRTFARTRLQLARAFNEVSQAELADKIGVGQTFIGKLETGKKQPSEIISEAIGDALGFDAEFFYSASPDEFRAEDWSFRRYQSATAAATNRIVAQGALFGLLVDYLDTVLKLPPDTMPSIRRPTNREELEKSADHCRMHLGLGLDVPIKNVIRAFERAGVVVSAASGTSGRIDAMSRSAGRRPIIIVSDDKNSPARRRYDVGHEGGHLVLHPGLETGTPETESEANAFSSAFLLPRRGFIREFPRPPVGYWTRSYWRDLFDLKKRWRVSVAAIVRRAFDLKMIDAAQYQRAYKFMSGRGWLRHGEPPETEPEMEVPELLPRALSLLSSRCGIFQRDVAASLHWKPHVLERVAGIQVSDPPVPEHHPSGAKIIPLSLARSSNTKPGTTS